MEYIAQLEAAAEGGFVITFPDFGWGVSQADTEEEAIEMARALLKTLIAEHIRKGEDLPQPRSRRGKQYRTVRLPAMQDAKAELYREFSASGMRKVDLARRLGMPKANVDRLFSLKHHSRLEQIEAAFRALGKSMVIEILAKEPSANRPGVAEDRLFNGDKMETAIPDLTGWEAYCNECEAFREPRRADEHDTESGSEYFEFVCKTCHSILLTFQRLGTQPAESKPPEPLGTSARCPHCGELNVFPRFEQILAYVCQHCGESVDATPPVQ